jgi:hypothetical protein
VVDVEVVVVVEAVVVGAVVVLDACPPGLTAVMYCRINLADTVLPAPLSPLMMTH